MVIILEFNLDILENSKWITCTQNEMQKTFPFICTEIGDFYAGKDFFTERDYKDSFWLIYTLEGEGTLLYNNSKIKLNAGSCALIDCKNYQKYYTSENCELWHHYWMHINGIGVKSICSILNTNCLITNSLFDNEIKQEFETAFINCKQNTTLESINMTLQIHLILHRLAETNLDNIYNEENKKEEMQSIAKYIRHHYNEPFNIDNLSAMAHLSKYYFIRTFRKYIGTTPYDYLLNFRITKAKELLCKTQWGIGKIGTYIGFCTESNFSTQFSRIVSISPNKFRKENYSIENK